MRTRQPLRHARPAQLAAAAVPGAGRGLMASANIRKGDLLLAVPPQLLITPEAALQRSALRGLLEDRAQPLPAWSVLALWLVEARAAGDRDLWWPYLRLLPRRTGCVLEWSEEEVGWLAGSQLGEAAAEIRGAADASWAEMEPLLAAAAQLGLGPPGVFCREALQVGAGCGLRGFAGEGVPPAEVAASWARSFRGDGGLEAAAPACRPANPPPPPAACTLLHPPPATDAAHRLFPHPPALVGLLHAAVSPGAAAWPGRGRRGAAAVRRPAQPRPRGRRLFRVGRGGGRGGAAGRPKIPPGGPGARVVRPEDQRRAAAQVGAGGWLLPWRRRLPRPLPPLGCARAPCWPKGGCGGARCLQLRLQQRATRTHLLTHHVPLPTHPPTTNSYGFCPEPGANPHDGCKLRLSLRDGDPAAAAKAAALARRGFAPSQLFPLRMAAAPWELTHYAALCVAEVGSEAEAEALAARLFDGDDMPRELQAAALEAVVHACQRAQQAYPSSLEADRAELEELQAAATAAAAAGASGAAGAAAAAEGGSGESERAARRRAVLQCTVYERQVLARTLFVVGQELKDLKRMAR